MPNPFNRINFNFQPPEPQRRPDITSGFNDMLNRPDGPGTAKYRDFLSQPEPSRADFKPTKMSRLAAILAGVSSGVRDGGKAGFESARSILDRPYDEAVQQRNLMAERLKAGAAEEGNSDKERISILKNIIDANNVHDDNVRQDTLAGSTVSNNASAIEKRKYDMTNSGFTPAVDLSTGQRIYTNPNGQVRNTGVNVAQTPGQKLEDQKKLAGYNSGLVSNRSKTLFDYTNPITSHQQDARQTEGYRLGGINQRASQENNDGLIRNRTAATREMNNSYAAYRRIVLSDPDMADHFDSDTGLPTDDIGSKLLREVMSQMETSVTQPTDPRLIVKP